MKKIKYFYLWIIILILFIEGCSKSVDMTNSDTKEESKKVIDELKSENSKLKSENTQLSQEVENQKKLLELRNSLDVKFYYLLVDMSLGKIDEIKKEVTANVTVYNDKLVSQLQTGAWNFKFPEDNVRFRERDFFLKSPQIYEATYEVWNPEEERLLECYVDYSLVGDIWKLNSIFIDGGNQTGN